MQKLSENKELWDLYCLQHELDSTKRDPYERHLAEYFDIDFTKPKAAQFIYDQGFRASYPNGAKFAACMTHDIDINPNENMILKYYIDPIPENTIKGIFTSMCDTLGGIIKFRSDTFFNINGFPNDIWGWGHEDKALQNRAVFKNLKINKNILSNDPNISNYLLRFNDVDDRVTPSNFGLLYNKYYNNKTNIQDMLSSGLNNLQYKIIEKKNINDYVELIKVSI